MSKVIVTGGAGFIGSALVWALNEQGEKDILIVDHLGSKDKWKNLRNLKFADYIEKDKFLEKLKANELDGVETIFHMGACSSTTESDCSYLVNNNFEYSKQLALYSVWNNVKFLYASSAATYGLGELGYSDNIENLQKLQPLNMYGYSKHLFDLWLKEQGFLDKVCGLKFFNVFGPNEYHKCDMRSMVCKGYEQIKATGKMKLFKSYVSEYKDGEQKRDFVYIKDVCKMVLDLYRIDAKGIYNIGAGKANTWNDLANAIFKAMDKKPKIDYVEMPEVLKEKYQYFTEADMSSFPGEYNVSSLDDAVADYVRNYLSVGGYL